MNRILSRLQAIENVLSSISSSTDYDDAYYAITAKALIKSIGMGVGWQDIGENKQWIVGPVNKFTVMTAECMTEDTALKDLGYIKISKEEGFFYVTITETGYLYLNFYKM